jgi:hypothetical protein
MDGLNEVFWGYINEAFVDLELFHRLAGDRDNNIKRRALFFLQQSTEKAAKAYAYHMMMATCVLISNEPLSNYFNRKEYREMCNRIITKDIGKVREFLRREYGHNARILMQLNNTLYQVLRNNPDLIDKIVQRLIDLVKLSVNELNERERILSVISPLLRRFIAKVLKSTVDSPAGFIDYKNYDCIDDILTRFHNAESSLSSLNQQIQQIINTLKDAIPRLIGMCGCQNIEGLNEALDAASDVLKWALRAYSYANILVLPMVNCMGLFEQTSRYCLAEDESKCPPVDDRSMEKYREVAMYLDNFINMRESVKVFIQLLDQAFEVLNSLSRGTEPKISIDVESSRHWDTVKSLAQCMYRCINRFSKGMN